MTEVKLWPAALSGLLILTLGLAACSGPREGDYYPEEDRGGSTEIRRTGEEPEQGLLGSALTLGSVGSIGSKEATGLGVNSFLWRASLDTLSFMPLTTADPVGGVIISDWHASPSVPNERFKLTVYILDTRLRADGVRVSVFRQERRDGQWQDATVNPSTATQLENQILRRARELKVGVGDQ